MGRSIGARMNELWGLDASLFSGWALVENFVWRLPLPVQVDERYISWREAAMLHDNPLPTNGYVAWDEITAWKGSGPPGPLGYYQPIYPNEAWASSLENCLIHLVGTQPWVSANRAVPLADVVSDWRRQRDLGRWSCRGVGLAAPAYADSAIVSGPQTVGTVLKDHGFEAWPVAPSRQRPPMTS